MKVEPTEFNVLQDVDFDPMEILHGGGKLPDASIITGNQSDKDDDDDDPDAAGDAGKTKAKAVKPAEDAGLKLDISDEEFDELVLKQGLKNAGKVTVKEEGDDEGDEGDEDNEGDDDPDADKGDKGTKKPKYDKATAFSSHYETMVALGEWEEDPDFDGTEESYLKIREKNDQLRIDTEVESILDEAFKKNPTGKVYGKQLLNHLANGGTIQQFVDLYAASTDIDITALDGEDEDAAEAAAEDLYRDYYASIGWSAKKIDEKVAKLKKTGLLVDESKEIVEPWQALKQEEQQATATALKQRKEQEKKERIEFNQGLTQLIDKGHKFGTLPVYKDKKDRIALEDFIFTPDEKTGRSQYSQELNAALKDPEFVLFAAAALKNKWYKGENAEKTFVDPKKVETATKSKLEEALEKSLLNKKVSDKTANVTSTSAQSSRKSRVKFDLDDALNNKRVVVS